MVAIFWDTVDIMVDMDTDMEDGLTTDTDTMDKPRSSSNTISNKKAIHTFRATLFFSSLK